MLNKLFFFLGVFLFPSLAFSQVAMPAQPVPVMSEVFALLMFMSIASVGVLKLKTASKKKK